MRGIKSRRGVAALLALTCAISGPLAGADPGDALQSSNPGVTPPTLDKWTHGAGDLSISEQTGALTYAYPITVPPGRQGMQPSLALTYSSAGPRRGGIAAGWSLDVPTIERDLSRGLFNSEVWVSGLAGGQRLLKKAGTTSEYRAEFDTSQARYFRTGFQWEARTTDGHVYVFNDSAYISGAVPAYRALLTSTRDAFGNTVKYFWKQNTPTSSTWSWELSRIEYTSNTAAGLVHHAEVVLNWAPSPTCEGWTRVGAAISVRSGLREMQGAYELSSIVTRVRDSASSSFRTVRTVKLGYDAAAKSCSGVAAPTRLLASIEESAVNRSGVTTTLPKKTFAYGALWQSPFTTLSGFAMPNNGTKSGVSWGTTGNWGALATPPQIKEMLLDLDGDGLVDRLKSAAGKACTLSWLRNTGAGFVASPAIPLPLLAWDTDPDDQDVANTEGCTISLQHSNENWPGAINDSLPNDGCTYVDWMDNAYRYMDLDGDALPELITARWFGTKQAGSTCEDESPESWAEWNSDGTYPVKIYKNLGNGVFATTPVDRNWPTSLDATGGNSFARPIKPTPAPSVGDAMEREGFYDLDGDAKIDFVEVADNGAWTLRRGDGAGVFGSSIPWAAPLNTALSKTHVSNSGGYNKQLRTYQALYDVNGDGLPDLLIGSSNSADTGSIVVYLNKGDGFETSAITISNVTPSSSFARMQTLVNYPEVNGAERWFAVRLLDVDGDGLVDLSHGPDLENSTTARVYANRGLSWIGPGASIFATDYSGVFSYGSDHGGKWTIESDMIDVNGDGVSEIVMGGTVLTRDPSQPPPALLYRVDNGQGGVTLVTYASAHDPSVVAQSGGRLPSARWVVRDITREATPAAAAPSTTTYRYEKPVFNRGNVLEDDWAFRGFTKALATSPLGAVTETSFDYSVRFDGLPIETVVRRADGSLHTRTTTEYTTFASAPTTVTFPTTTRAQTFFDGTGPGRGSESPTVVTTTHYAYLSQVWLSDSQEVEVIAPNALVPAPTKKRSTSSYEITNDAQTYHVRPDNTETFEWRDNAWAITGRTDETWDGPRNTMTHAYYDPTYLYGFAQTRRTYRASGQVDTVRRPVESEHLWEGQPSVARQLQYDSFDLFLTREIDELGIRHDFEADLATGATIRAYDPYLDDAAPKRWVETTTDGFGRVRTVARATASTTEVQKETIYVDGLNPSSTTKVRRDHGAAPNWISTKAVFDGFGRLYESIRNPETTNPPKTTYAYDAGGNLAWQESPNPRDDAGPRVKVSFEYDSLGRVRRTVAPGVAPTHIDYDGTFARRYQVPTDDSEAMDSTLYYDAAGSLVRVDEKTLTDVATTVYEYNGNGHLAKITDADGVISTYQHNALGWRTQIRRGNRYWVYGYDRNGNLISEHTPVPWPQPPGVATTDFVNTYTYDAIDRRTSQRAGRGFLGGTAMPGVHETHGITYLDYDTGCEGNAQYAIGKLCRVRSPIGTTTYAYDADSQLSSEHRALSVNVGGGNPITIDETIAFTYNAMGSPLDVKHARGTQQSLIRYGYDATGLPLSVGAAVSPNGTPGTPKTLATLERSPRSFVLRNRYIDDTHAGSYQHWKYDDLGRVTHNEVWSGGAITAGETATFYSNGNVATLKDLAANVTFSYDYDPQHQIIGVSTSDPALYAAAFEYTRNGRIKSAYVGSLNQSTDVFPRDVIYYYPYGFEAPYSILDRGSGQPVVELGYDDSAGNIVRRKAAGRALRFWHDAEDAVRGVEEEGTSSREMYIYDHAGTRILSYSTARGNQPARLRHWFGPAETAYSPTSTVETNDVHVSLGGSAIARIANGDLTTIGQTYSNALGHLLAAIDTQGELTARFTYGPFGELVQAVGVDAPTYRRRFNGKELDAFTDVAYYGFRFYDRLTMTWTQPDPLYRLAPDIRLDSPRDASLYTFVNNNPLRFVDPDGLERNWLSDVATGVRDWVQEGAADVHNTFGNDDTYGALNGAAAGAAATGHIEIAAGAKAAEYSIQAAGYIAVNITGNLAEGESTPADMVAKFEAAIDTNPRGAPRSHGNSADDARPQHRYEIVDTEAKTPRGAADVVKTGISGRALKTDGTSKRAASQVRKLNRQAGRERFTARVVQKNIAGRRAALHAEKLATRKLHLAGHSLRLQKLPRPW
jgi:RHS repeat-associated protein